MHRTAVAEALLLRAVGARRRLPERAQRIPPRVRTDGMLLGVLEVLLALEDEPEPLAERVAGPVRDLRVGVDVVARPVQRGVGQAGLHRRRRETATLELGQDPVGT